MTDHDRGAYTPQPDAPLQFDARGPRMRRPMPMTLIGSGAVLVVLLGALALHYRADNKPEKPAAPTAEKVAEVKPPPAAAATAPAAPAKPVTTVAAAPGAAVDVFGGAAHDPAKAPTLAAPPEAPKPRQQLTVQATETPVVKSVPTTVASATAPVAEAKPAATTAARPSTYKAPSVATVAAPPAKKKSDATQIVNTLAAQTPSRVAAQTKAFAAAASPVKPAALASTASAKSAAASLNKPAPTGPALAKAATAAPGATSASAGAVVQIGAFSSAALSDKGWSDVSAAMASAMSGKTKRVEVVEKDGKTFYRTSVAGFPSRAAADSFCKALSAKGKACFAKGA